MIELKTPDEIDRMRLAGQITAQALEAVRVAAAVGVRLDELDTVGADVITAAGAQPLFLDYYPSWAPSPYPGVACISVNDAVVHGIPGCSPWPPATSSASTAARATAAGAATPRSASASGSTPTPRPRSETRR